MTPDRAIELYLRVRERKAELVERHKEELRPFNEALEKLEGMLLQILHGAGLKNMKSARGTAYERIEVSVTVADWSITLPWIVEHQAWDLLDKRVNKTTVQTLIEDTGLPPPGVTVRQEARIGVRKAD